MAASGRYERLDDTNKKLKGLSADIGSEDPESKKELFNASTRSGGAGKVGQTPNRESNTIDRAELITELRHKYITILKSLYWEYFEAGQCTAPSVGVLIESADRALDTED